MANLQFDHRGTSPSGRTSVWVVRPVRNLAVKLGEIRWYGQWRRYCLFPEFDTTWDPVCLGEVASFCRQVTKCHGKS